MLIDAGLSWLIGGSLQEVLTSIIFLFIKHPFDVGDRVVMNSLTYTVKEIRLLSTVFLDSNSTLVQAPNNVLNTLVSDDESSVFCANNSHALNCLVYSKHPQEPSGEPMGIARPCWTFNNDSLVFALADVGNIYL